MLKGDRVEVSLNATSITILHKKKSFGFYKLKYESQILFFKEVLMQKFVTTIIQFDLFNVL